MEHQNPFFKHALEPVFLGHIPLFVDDFERNILVRWSSFERDNDCVELAVFCILKEELRGLELVKEVEVENIEFVPLNNFWWRIVSIVVSLVVLVPLEPCLDGVEVPRL